MNSKADSKVDSSGVQSDPKDNTSAETPRKLANDPKSQNFKSFGEKTSMHGITNLQANSFDETKVNKNPTPFDLEIQIDENSGLESDSSMFEDSSHNDHNTLQGKYGQRYIKHKTSVDTENKQNLVYVNKIVHDSVMENIKDEYEEDFISDKLFSTSNSADKERE